jgi:hypothetical protein
MSEDLRRQGHDLHVLLGAKLTSNGSEDTSSDRLAILVNKNSGVGVKANVAAVLATELLGGADDNSPNHRALLDLPVGDGFFDADDDDVTDRSILSLAATDDLDALKLLGAGVVSNVENGMRLNHFGVLLAR